MMELVCPAGTPAALRAAVEAGAHSVYCGFNDETNARNFPGLNFSPDELAEAVGFAHGRGTKVLVAINTFPRAGAEPLWHRAVANAETAGADAVILADIVLLSHAAEYHPTLRRHLSVQAAAANPDAINLYASAFGVRRVVLPRVLTVEESPPSTERSTSRPKSLSSAAFASWPKDAVRCPPLQPASLPT